MADDHDKREGEAVPDKPPKIKANENPWYLLATLYGEPADELYYSQLRELQDRNRTTWNRYYSAILDSETRTRLIEEKRHTAEELTAYLTMELDCIANDFAARCKTVPVDFPLPSVNEVINFKNVEFVRESNFNNYLFTQDTYFDGATFSDGADFEDTQFSRWARFENAIFSDRAAFKGATFGLSAAFNSATFSGVADFEGATFSGVANFQNATFSKSAAFGSATFSGEAILVNAEMKGETSFEGAIFKAAPPKFFGAKLHEGTVWRGVKWPTPNTAAEAGPFIDAYERLKLEMDRLKKHEDELNFFALELRSRRVLLGLWKGWPILVYGAVADYGRSYWTPLGWLCGIAFVGGLLLLPYFDLALGQPLGSSIGQSFGLSLVNTLDVLGFRKDFIDPTLVECLPWGLKALSGAQTILGGVLLFLFGLGIRNRFRMK